MYTARDNKTSFQVSLATLRTVTEWTNLPEWVADETMLPVYFSEKDADFVVDFPGADGLELGYVVERPDVDALRQAAFEAEVLAAYETHADKGLSCGPRKVHVNREWFDMDKGSFLFAFGAYSPTYILAYGSCEAALERAAETLKEIAPGCFSEPDYKAARDDIMGESTVGDDMISEEAISERAETDLTYTESGYLPSWEWTIVGENMSHADVLAFVRNA